MVLFVRDVPFQWRSLFESVQTRPPQREVELLDKLARKCEGIMNEMRRVDERYCEPG